MEDTKETVKDRVVGAVRRNRTKIVYTAAGVAAGALATRIYSAETGAAFARRVVETVNATGEHPITIQGVDLVITKPAKS